MIARNHWKWSGAWWLWASAAAASLVPVDPAQALGLAVLAACAGLGPDLDKPPEGGHPGATAAEAHGLISNALAELVSATHGGHRGLTHRYRYAWALGLGVALLAYLWPVPTVATLLAWWGAWPLYCQMPRRTRWAAAVIAPAGTALAWSAGALPATPWAGAAVALGWAGHIAGDRIQSAFFEIGGTFERVLVGVTLAGAAGIFALALFPHHFS